MFLRQSTASQEIILGPFMDDTDGKTAETGLTIANTDIKIWKHGATTEANKNSGGATHIASGRYSAVLDATDTNTLGNLEINVDVTGALPVRREYTVLPAVAYDALILGIDNLDVNTVQLAGTAQTGRDIGASVLLSSGTGTGQVSLSSGQVTVSTNNDKTGYSISGTKTTLDALNDVSAATVNAQVDTALTDIHLDHLLAVNYDPASKPGVSTALLNEIIGDDGGVSRFTANALELAPSGGGDATSANQTTIIGHLTDIKGGTFSGTTDSLEAIRDRGDAAWTTGAGGTPPQLLQSTTIATLASQTSFTLTAGSADNDAYNGAVVIITDSSTATQKAVGSVLDYVGSTKTVTLAADPGIFTMAAGDSIDILAATGSVTGTVSADVVSISGDSTAADNLELMFDGTGYTAGTAPSSRDQVAGLTVSGGGGGGSAGAEATVADSNAGGTDPLKGVTFVGTVAGGAFTNLNSEDTSTLTINSSSNSIDVVFRVRIPKTGQTASLVLNAGLQGSGDTATVYVYDNNATGWQQVSSFAGAGSLSYDSYTAAIGEARFSDTSGDIFIRITCATGTMTLGLNKLTVSYINRTVGYANGAIWLDTVNGVSGVVPFTNGTADNPTNSWANALSLAASLSLSRFEIAAGSSITLTAASNNYELNGHNWTLALGGQSISNTRIIGANVSGTFTAASPPIFDDCVFAGNVTAAPFIARNSFFDDITITAGSAGDFYFNKCVDRATGTATPTFDFSTVGNTNLNIHDYSGGFTVDNMNDSGVDTVVMSGAGIRFIGAASNTGGTVTLLGTGQAPVDASANLTINTTGFVSVAGIKTQADTALTDYDPPTKTELDSGLAGLNDLDAAGVRTAVGLASANLDTQLNDIDSANSTITTNLATVDTVVDSIKAKTDSLGFTSGRINANTEALNNDTDAVARLRSGVKGNVTGTVGASSTTTSITTSALSPSGAATDQFKGRILTFTNDTTTATLRGQATDITANTSAATPTFTVTALTTAPASSDTFTIT